MMEFCNESSQTIPSKEMQTDAMQKTCQSLSNIFFSLGKDFEKIAEIILNSFSDKEIMEEKIKKSQKSLRDRILENASEWINKTELWRKTKSDKKRCFDAIDYLVKEEFLETKKEGNMHKFRRI